MTRKQWAILAAAMTVLGFMSIIGLVVLIDPFQIYHQATAFIAPIDNGHQIYANAGIAKSYEYDSVIIGSSMTENFVPSQLDELFDARFVKLCVNAGTPFNHKQMLDMAYADHDLKHVLYGLDVELMTYFYTTPKCEMPEYLYDDDLFNDVHYWFNTTVLARYIPKCLKTLGQSDPAQRDTMYSWGDLYPYGAKAVIGDLTFSGKKVKQEKESAEPTLDQAYKLNVEHNLIPFIEAHPETQFTFFFAPYSALRWYQFYRDGLLEYYLNQKAAVTAALLPYENVKIFDFQSQVQWITDLNHYIDTSHYGPWINEEIAVMMSRDECRVTDVSQIRESSAVIRRLVDHIRACGQWPEDFPIAALPQTEP